MVGDNQARHLFHSEYAESDKLVGTQMVGGDNFDVLAGKSVITVRHGSIGVSLRSKAPIVADGQVIGIVSVGYLKTHIDNLTFSKLAHILLAILALFVALFIFSVVLAESEKADVWPRTP